MISIISLLIAILLPALSAARDQARRIQCGSGERQIGIAFNVYAEDMQTFPNGRYNQSSLIGHGTHKVLRDSYNVTGNLVYCPASDSSQVGNSRQWDTSNSAGWSAAHMTYWYFAGPGTRTASPHQNRNGWKTSMFPHLDDGYYAPLDPEDTDKASRVPMLTDLMYPLAAVLNSTLPQESNHSTKGIEADGGNVLYVDGHVEFQSMVSGQSWLLNETPYGGYIYWNPTFTPPSSASYLP